MSKKRVSRRQFLSYSLMGVGGFMVSGTIMPMIRFAVDPVLQKSGESEFTATPQKVDELSETPVRVDYTIVGRKDGWYESDESYTAWVYKDGDKIVALSPVCKHLGCTVSWGEDNHPNEFFCPCHAGRYKKSGENIKGTPPIGPLDEFEVLVEDGFVHLGLTKPNTLV